jgi:hypothetical protein
LVSVGVDVARKAEESGRVARAGGGEEERKDAAQPLIDSKSRPYLESHADPTSEFVNSTRACCPTSWKQRF